ncbi:MAG TPA: hypothetical protein VNZ94_07740 [Xanthobacteraceae bacterium]|nr:hypothetical protein [Xanthobacteraceae bacterium]
MAETAIALTPSQPPASPAEGEFEAILSVFSETARGRWFLDEYTRRNRNADTTMVLDAVTRLEAAMAKQQADRRMRDLLEDLADIASEARSSIAEATQGPGATNLAEPARRGTRAIREITWTLRECGLDSDLCDEVDMQIDAIDRAFDRVIAADQRGTIIAILQQLTLQIETLSAEQEALLNDEPGETGDSVAAPAPAAATVTPLTIVPAPRPAAATPAPKSRVEEREPAPASPPPAIAMETRPAAAASIIDAPRPAREVFSRTDAPKLDAPKPVAPKPVAVAAREAQPCNRDLPAASQPMARERAAISHDAPLAATPAPALAATLQAQSIVPPRERAIEIPAAMPEPAAPLAAKPQQVPAPSHAGSLGAALVANGVVSLAEPRRADPLTAFARMSQAERVAFFS